jgi:signal transduction histidine kinase
MEGGVAETELERVDPAALVREVLRSTERTAVRVEVDGAAPAVCTIDRRRIAQVLTNLLDNADAYGDGATTVLLSGTSDSVLIAVDDAGPGVAPEEQLHVFERFARGGASEAKPGTGLGLALVVEHVRLHDGRVWVEDSPDGGARFVFQLPRDAP